MFIKFPKSKDRKINLTKYFSGMSFAINKACLKGTPHLTNDVENPSDEILKEMDGKLDLFEETATHEITILERVLIKVLDDKVARVFVSQDNIYLFRESVINAVLKNMSGLTFWHSNKEDKPLIIKAGENVVAIIMPIKVPYTLKDKIEAECKALVYALTDQNDKWELATAQETKG